jgi:aminoglycoside phosphotransferase (APT) family kinase protein|tara:strand:+ start:412 stop:987 length:576 start_codon:yes stop_codon:yes gene_type:complete
MLNTYMVYTLQNMMSGDWIEGKRLSVNNHNDNFVEQFVDCLIELHSQDFKKTDIKLMQSVVDNLEHVDSFVTDAISEYNTIKEHLQYNTKIHGDIWAGNVIVDSKGNFAGLIDWDNLQIGDIHWELRTIRRWIGWDGLDKLIDKYNSKTNLKLKKENIVILDKISLCHSRQLNKFRKSVFTEYIKRYPDGF